MESINSFFLKDNKLAKIYKLNLMKYPYILYHLKLKIMK